MKIPMVKEEWEHTLLSLSIILDDDEHVPFPQKQVRV